MSWNQVRNCGSNPITLWCREGTRIGDIGGRLLKPVLNLHSLGEKPTQGRTAGTGESTSLGCQGSYSAPLRIQRVDDRSHIMSNNGRGAYNGEEGAEGEDNILKAEHFEVGLRKGEIPKRETGSVFVGVLGSWKRLYRIREKRCE